MYMTEFGGRDHESLKGRVYGGYIISIIYIIYMYLPIVLDFIVK